MLLSVLHSIILINNFNKSQQEMIVIMSCSFFQLYGDPKKGARARARTHAHTHTHTHTNTHTHTQNRLRYKNLTYPCLNYLNFY